MVLFRAFVLLVGPACEPRPSFMDAYTAGVVVNFVSLNEFWKRFRAAAFHDVVVFNRRNQSEAQCGLCHQLLDQGQSVVCIGCEPEKCAPCYRPESDWLTALGNMYDEKKPVARINRQATVRNDPRCAVVSGGC